MEIFAQRDADGRSDPNAVLAAVPYCAWLGLSARIEDGAVLLELPFDPKLVGNPILPALHGGVIGSMLETVALVQVIWETRVTEMPKPVDITVDYLRSGRGVTSYARATLIRQGRRIVNARADMWQADPAKPIASFRGHFLLG